MLSHLPVLCPPSSSGVSPGETGAHPKNTCTHRPKVHELDRLRAGGFPKQPKVVHLPVYGPGASETNALPPGHTTPHHTTPHHTAPHRTAPHHTTPHRTAQHTTTPRSTHHTTHHTDAPKSCTFASLSAGGRHDHLPGAISIRFVARVTSSHLPPGTMFLSFVAGHLLREMFCFVATGPQTTISIRFVARWPSDHRSRGFRKQPKVAPLPVYGPGAETLHLPVFRPEPSKTAFSLLPVLFLSSAGLPREAGAHTNTRSHGSKSYAHANLRT